MAGDGSDLVARAPGFGEPSSSDLAQTVTRTLGRQACLIASLRNQFTKPLRVKALARDLTRLRGFTQE
jgi:hypothetical protein